MDLLTNMGNSALGLVFLTNEESVEKNKTNKMYSFCVSSMMKDIKTRLLLEYLTMKVLFKEEILFSGLSVFLVDLQFASHVTKCAELF